MKDEVHSIGSQKKGSRRADSRAMLEKKQKRFKDSEFEQMFGKDID